MKAPTNDVVRDASPVLASTEFRAADDPDSPYIGTLSGKLAVFNEWAEIDSAREGHFMERILPGAFTKTLSEQRAQIKVLYDHGRDAVLGIKPLGQIRSLHADDRAVHYEVDLIDTDYNRGFIVPAGREQGLLGASFRFRAINDEPNWNDRPGQSEHNPLGLPERSVRELAMLEFGPTPWGAYAGATSNVRSGTDDYLRKLLAELPADALRHLLDTGAADGTPAVTTNSNEPDGAPLGLTPGQRAAYLRSLTL